jgi:hypothetical protein
MTSMLAVAPAAASAADFLPRPFENGAYFEIFGSREHDAASNDGRTSEWTDTFFRERITLFSNGYVYHPRFLQYRISVSPGLKQERFETSFGASTEWVRSAGVDYDGRLYFLPEHPYNVELFALRREPLIVEQAATQHDSVETSNGVNLRYRRKPFFLHAGLLDNTTETAASKANVRRFAFDGQYFKRFVTGNEFSVTALVAPSEFSGNLGLEGSSTQYTVNGLLATPRVRLDVTATKLYYDQESPLSGRLETEQLTAQERLTADLPLHFRTDFYYRVLDDTGTQSFFTPVGSRELSDNSREFQFILSHRLYQSLDSRYIFLHADRTSAGGESSVVSHALGFDYTKLIAPGRWLSGLYLSTTRTDNSGRTDFVSEPHDGVAVPGAFTLTQQNIDRASLAIYLRSPLPPFDAVLLIENVHYTVTLVGNLLEIGVTTLPPQFAVPGTYDFFASYTLLVGNFEMRTDTYAFNASAQLFDNFLTPYYNLVAVRSDVISGMFPGIPLDSTTNTLGLSLVRGPWRAVGEFQVLDWDVSPYRSLRGEVQYIRSIDPTLRVSGTAALKNRYYPEGTSVERPEPVTDRSANLYANVQKEFLARTLTLAAGVSYARMFGLVDSDAYALSSSLTWRIGLIDLSAGIDMYGSDSENVGFGAYHRDHQYYYLKLVRRLF